MSKNQKSTKKKNVENVENVDNLKIISLLQIELDLLEDKKKKLKEFLWKDETKISNRHYYLLTMQYWGMCQYSDALYARILDLKNKF